MAIKKFEDIVAWQKAQDFSLKIYSIFKNSKDYGFRDQICRASISISSNIAEGFDYNSNTNFSRFLRISLGSCNETKSLIYLAEKLKYLTSKEVEELLRDNNEISRILHGLIKSMSPKK